MHMLQKHSRSVSTSCDIHVSFFFNFLLCSKFTILPFGDENQMNEM